MDNINALKGGVLSKNLKQFIEFSDILDIKQKVTKTWREIIPELREINVT